MATTSVAPEVHHAVVPCFDVSQRGCHTAWLPVGTVEVSDDGPGFMILLHTEVAKGEAIYFRTLPKETSLP